MKTDKLQEMIVRVRRVRAEESPDRDPPGLPPGLARKIVRVNQPEPTGQLLRFQTWSYAGLGVAATIALSVLFFQRSPEITSSAPTDPWMEMPMTDLIH